MQVWTRRGIFSTRAKSICRSLELTGLRVVPQRSDQHPHVAVSARGADDVLYDIHLTLADIDRILKFVRKNEDEFKCDRDPLVFHDR